MEFANESDVLNQFEASVSALQEQSAVVARSLNELGRRMQPFERAMINTSTLLGESSDPGPLGLSALLRVHEYLSTHYPFAVYQPDFTGSMMSRPGSGDQFLQVPVYAGVGEPSEPSGDEEPLSPPPVEELVCPCTKRSAQEVRSMTCGLKFRTVEDLVRHMTKTHPPFFIWQCYGGKLWPEMHRLKKHFCLKRRAQTRCYCTDERCVEPENDMRLTAHARVKDMVNKITPAQKAQGYRERTVIAKKRCVDHTMLLALLKDGASEEELAAKCLTKWEDYKVTFPFAGGRGA